MTSEPPEIIKDFLIRMLRNGVLGNADLRFSQLSKSNLYGADLNHSDLRQVNFTRARLGS